MYVIMLFDLFNAILIFFFLIILLSIQTALFGFYNSIKSLLTFRIY